MDKLDELARREKLKYFKDWRSKNRDKIKKNNQNYWRRKAERKLQEQQQQREG